MASPNNPIPLNEVRTKGKIEQHEHCRKADAKRVKMVDEEGNPFNDSNPVPVNATFSGAADAKNPYIFRVSMPTAGVEYEFQFPLNTDQFKMHPEKNKATIKYSYIQGESGTDYDKIKPGNRMPVSDLKLNGSTSIYFQSNISSNTMIIEVWTL